MKKLKNTELNRIDVPTFKKTTKSNLIVILDDIRSLNNIGSVFRTADAFLIKKIYLCGITATPPHRDIHRTALGATDSVDWEYIASVDSLIQDLQKNNIKIVAVEQVENAIALQEFHPDKNTTYALVFGNEVKGVQQSVVDSADFHVEIPQFGTKHSFNISVSAGIVMWDFFSKLKWQM